MNAQCIKEIILNTDHPLFQHFPLESTALTSVGEVPTPYHIYDGYGVFIGGTADLTATTQLLAGEVMQPVQTIEGRALMGIWVCDFTEASLGPHHELQFSIFVSRAPMRDVPAKPLGLLSSMLTRTDMLMMCHGLWNNTEKVVAYNRELLSLNARRCESAIVRAGDALTFNFTDAGQLVLSGKIDYFTKSALRANFEMGSLAGYSRLMALGRQPWLNMQVVNPHGVVLDQNAIAQTYTKPSTTAIRYFEVGKDSLSFGETLYSRLGFVPQFAQGMTGFKFVYLLPEMMAA
jgi:hypothetical protein